MALKNPVSIKHTFDAVSVIVFFFAAFSRSTDRQLKCSRRGENCAKRREKSFLSLTKSNLFRIQCETLNKSQQKESILSHNEHKLKCILTQHALIVEVNCYWRIISWMSLEHNDNRLLSDKWLHSPPTIRIYRSVGNWGRLSILMAAKLIKNDEGKHLQNFKLELNIKSSIGL